VKASLVLLCNDLCCLCWCETHVCYAIIHVVRVGIFLGGMTMFHYRLFVQGIFFFFYSQILNCKKVSQGRYAEVGVKLDCM
jgi:hypothetical protein